MKIAATFLAAAALVSAAPIRVVVVTNANGATGKVNFESLTAVRFGHAAAGAQGIPEPAFAMSEPVRMIRPGQPGHPTLRFKHHCKGGLRDKAVALWNSFTGFISHKVTPHRPFGDEIDPDKLAIYTSPGILSPHLREKLRADAAKLNGGATVAAHPPVSPPFIRVSRPHQAPIHEEPFMYRLSRALSMLGPWEGRAMAFVFGCGLGVLIRMIHVMILLLVRSRRCKKERAVTLGTEEEQAPLYVAPPEYVIFDEKEADAVPAEVVVVVESVQQK